MRGMWAVLVPLAAMLAGCLSCQPVLEAHACHEGERGCDPDAEDVRQWSASDAAAWPEVDVLVRSMAAGDHEHADWTHEKEEAFWDHWGIPEDEVDKQVFVALGGVTYRLRVYTCD